MVLILSDSQALTMKFFGIFFTALLVFIFTSPSYANRYLSCDDFANTGSSCNDKDALYVVPEGAIYAHRIHNPRKIPEQWCPNKPYLITRAELNSNLLNAKLIEAGKSCRKFSRYTAKIWAGDPYCLDKNFEKRKDADWIGEFYACDNRVGVKFGEEYFLVYAMIGDVFDKLDQVIDDNQVLNSETGEKQRGFVSFMITHKVDISPVYKVVHTIEENLAIIREAIREAGNVAVQFDCQIRPHDYEKNEKFDALVTVSKTKDGQLDTIVSLNIIENVSHGEARSALDFDECKELRFFGY